MKLEFGNPNTEDLRNYFENLHLLGIEPNYEQLSIFQHLIWIDVESHGQFAIKAKKANDYYDAAVKHEAEVRNRKDYH